MTTPSAANFYPVILAGGSGERFWPLSRRAKPKQFLALDDTGLSLLQATVERVAGLSDGLESVFVVTGNDHRALVLEQLPDLPLENLLVEPVGRDTAPAVLYAALKLAQVDPGGVMGVFPSDHRVGDVPAFDRAVRRARHAAEKYGALVTLGIAPTYPATGYGYIERGPEVEGGDLPLYAVSQFVEKPELERAEQFVRDGGYAWNGGMFVWTLAAILDAYRTWQPKLFAALSAAVDTRGGVKGVFPTLEKISIDYAVLERARNVMLVPADFAWDDMGDWNSLERLLRGSGTNVEVGRHVGLDTDGAILYTTGGDDLIATIGLEDVVVVRAGEVTLVVRKDRTQDIKKVVAQLKNNPELERFA